MHGAALAAHQAAIALHQFAEHGGHRRAAGQRMGMTAIGAEALVGRLHGGGETGGDGFLAERKMAGALDQVLQEEVIGALLAMADFHLQPPHL